MASRTVTIFKRERTTLNNVVRSFSFTFAPKKTGEDQDVLGITFDGKFLWLSTEDDGGLGGITHLLQVDIPTGTLVQRADATGVYSLRDIVWNGNGFYALNYDGNAMTPTMYLTEISSANWSQTRHIATGIPTTCSAIAYDGKYIYVTDYVYAAYLRVYDPATGAQVWGGYCGSITLWAQTEWGIVHDGHYLLVKNDPTVFAPANIVYHAHLRTGATAWNPVRTWTTSGAAATGESMRVTYDGKYLYDFTQVTV